MCWRTSGAGETWSRRLSTRPLACQRESRSTWETSGSRSRRRPALSPAPPGVPAPPPAPDFPDVRLAGLYLLETALLREHGESAWAAANDGIAIVIDHGHGDPRGYDLRTLRRARFTRET